MGVLLQPNPLAFLTFLGLGVQKQGIGRVIRTGQRVEFGDRQLWMAVSRYFGNPHQSSFGLNDRVANPLPRWAALVNQAVRPYLSGENLIESQNVGGQCIYKLRRGIEVAVTGHDFFGDAQIVREQQG
jgi:hypothetical protein